MVRINANLEAGAFPRRAASSLRSIVGACGAGGDCDVSGNRAPAAPIIIPRGPGWSVASAHGLKYSAAMSDHTHIDSQNPPTTCSGTLPRNLSPEVRNAISFDIHAFQNSFIGEPGVA